MNYLFFDLEYATSEGGNIKICEFGYVITDEKFNIQERNNFIINPNIKRHEWDYRVVREILTRDIKEYEDNPTFKEYYPVISKLIKRADYVFGHTTNGDANAINCDCKRYNLPSINFKFYDIREFYKYYSNSEKNVSVADLLEILEIDGEEGLHDAEVDAVNTMYELKTILQKNNVSLETLIQACPAASDFSENYLVHSLEIAKQLNEEKMQSILRGENSNIMSKHSKELLLFIQFIDNVAPTTIEEQTLKDLNFSISDNYEEAHFRQMLNIVQMLTNKGAKYVRNPSKSNIFVTSDYYNEDITTKNYKNEVVRKEIENGADIKIVSFEDFLQMLSITGEDLDNMPMVSFDCLYKEGAVIKDKKTKKYFETHKKEAVKVPSKDNGSTLGSLFGDLFAKLKNELEDDE